jgi:predicted nucleotide-binding protein (sugar kinase/HSP70/actin superfamily)
MLDLIELGVPNIVCTQPFGCLPNHVAGKGMIRKIKDEHPDSNIVAIDYDPSATRINQENRIKLMLANAQRIGHSNAAPTAPEQEAVPV